MFANTLGAREFSLRDPMVFIMYGIVLAFIVALSLYYMISAFKRAKQLGIESSKSKKSSRLRPLSLSCPDSASHSEWSRS